MTLASSAKDVKFYRWSDMSFIGVYETPVDCMSVKSISWCCVGNKILVTKSKGSPVIIDVPTKLDEHIEFNDCVNIPEASCGAFSHMKPEIAAFGFESGDIYIYNATTKQKLDTESKTLPSSIQNLEFSHGDRNVAVGCSNSQIFLLNSKYKPCACLDSSANASPLSCLCYSKNIPNLLISGSKDGILSLWDTETLDTIMTVKNHTGRITDLNFVGNFLASVGTDGKFVSYDLRTQSPYFNKQLDCPLSSLAYLQGSPELALSTSTGQLRSYDLRNMSSPLRTLVANSHGGIKKIAFPHIESYTYEEETDSFDKIYDNDYSASGDFSILTDTKFSETETKSSEMCAYKETPPVEVLASPKSVSRSAELEEFSKVLDEIMKICTKEFEDKLHQTFYTLRINTSKQFIALEGKIDRSWNNFVEYLKLSGTDSLSNINKEKRDDSEIKSE